MFKLNVVHTLDISSASFDLWTVIVVRLKV
jgi:hypothetical protein